MVVTWGPNNEVPGLNSTAIGASFAILTPQKPLLKFNKMRKNKNNSGHIIS